MDKKEKKVTGLGGIMFKSKAPDATRKWYENMLGIEDDPYGYKFEWIDKEDTGKTGVTVWSPMPEDSDYLGDADQQYMINYRVHNLERLTVQLRENGVVILDEIEEYEGLGKFLHIIDIDGRRVELWEPA
ncbi:MAG: VOC family protein [Prevotellaceae bacterium]|nr:VOC family protein [Prevotellaceae bacterium]